MSSPNPSPSSGGSNWLIVLVVVLGLIVLACGGLCAGCVVVARQARTAVQKELEAGFREIHDERRRMEQQLLSAYIAAHMAVETDAQVIDRLGKPIEPVGVFKHPRDGDLTPTGEKFQFDIEGSKGTGIVSGVAVSDGDVWRATNVKVTFQDGSVIDVPVPEDSEVAPESKSSSDGIQLDPELNEPSK